MFAARCSSLTSSNPSPRRALPAEELDDRDPGDVLLQERVHARDLHAHVAVRVARALAEPVRDPEHRQEDPERDRRERGVEREEHADDPRENDDVAEERDEAGREELVQGVDVRREARHEAPDGRPVEDGDVRALEVPEDPRPEVVHDALAHRGRPPDHDHHEDEREDRRRDGEGRDPLDAVAAREVDPEDGEEAVDALRGGAGARPLAREDEVDRGRRQERARELREGLEEQDRERARRVGAVRLREAEEPAQEARLDGLSEDLFLVVVGHQAASISSARRWRSAIAA